jgi:hypothetical protein
MDIRSAAVCGVACAWLLLFPHSVQAASEAVNCIPETTDMTIGYGTVVNGTNCVIAPGTDVDVFRFSASIGEVVRITVSNVAGPAGLLVQIRDPGGNLILTIGNPVIGEGTARFVVRTIEMSGSHSIAIFDAGSDQTASYGVVVERIVPAGPGAVPLAFNVPVSDELNPTNDIDQYRFEAQAGSVVRISIDPDITELGQFAMLQIASPSGPLSGGGEFSGSGPFFRDVTVTETGTQTFQLRPYRPDLAPYPYTVRIDCLSGPCAPPDCTVEVEPTFADGTLTLGFHLGNRLGAATWNVSLAVSGQIVPLWSSPINNVDPMVSFDVPIPGLPSLGGVAVISSISTSARGIACFDAETVDTGAAAAGATADSVQGAVGGR